MGGGVVASKGQGSEIQLYLVGIYFWVQKNGKNGVLWEEACIWGICLGYILKSTETDVIFEFIFKFTLGQSIYIVCVNVYFQIFY